MMRFLARLQPWSLTLVRLVAGFALLYYSWDKVYPHGGFHHGNLLAPENKFNDYVAHLGLPRWLGYLSTAAEFLGGLALMVGLCVRFASFFILINMLVALFLVNIHEGYTGAQLTLSLIAMSFLLFTAGGGRLALDRRFGIS